MILHSYFLTLSFSHFLKLVINNRIKVFMKKLIIVDLSNFIFRAFFAIRPLNAPDGTPVNAVYGILSMLFNLIQKHQPTHILVARDTKEGSFRKDIFPDYKAHRSAPPEDLIPQFNLIDELIDCLNLPEIKIATFEADDIIGSAATQWSKNFDEIFIASGDKDLMQFVQGPVKVLDTMKEKIYEREDVKDKMGVYPEQVMDFLALTGDSSDNIPGVAGIGPKGAQKLIESYGTLESILEHKDEVKNKRTKSALNENSEMAIISKKLVRIVTDIDLPLSWEKTRFHLTYNTKLEEFLKQLGFKSWIKKLQEFKLPDGADFISIKNHTESNAHETPIIIEKELIKWSLDELENIIKKEEAISLIPILENESDQFTKWKGVIIGSSHNSNNGMILFKETSSKSFFNILNSSNSLVISYQSKIILQGAMLEHVWPEFHYFDLAQAQFMIKPEYRYDFNTIAFDYLNLEFNEEKIDQMDFLEQIPGSILNDKKTLSKKSSAMLKLHPILVEKIEEIDVGKAFYDLDIPLIKVLAAMELEGIHLNIPFYQKLEQDFSNQIHEIESEVRETAGDTINLRSPKQVGELLFEKLNLPVIKKTKTGFSTNADVLNQLASMNLSPIPSLLLKYREVEKLLSTYVKALPQMVNSKTQKIHTHFQPSNAATGRLSSDHPNLQNIPIRTENGRKLREGFIPSPQNVLLSADYSQVELRLLAHFSQDPNMLEAFHNDKDIHSQTAAEIFDVPLNSVTKEMRSSAKAINFGLMYGQTSFGLSQTLNISQAEAKKYITSYFQKFHAVKGYLDQLKEKAERSGYAETLFGRKRFLPDIRSSNRQLKSMAERMAINSPIQGTAADIIKLAMINIDRLMREKSFKSKMILQVHDELIFDTLKEELDELKVIVQDQMENAVSLSVKLKVDIGVGSNWYDLK